MPPLACSCFLLSLLGRLLLALPFLLGICFPSLWSPPFPLQGLAHLDSLPPRDLVLWTDGSVPFPFGKGGSGVLANCSLSGTKPLFPSQQAQYVQVFPLKPAPFCKLFAGLGSKSATSLLHLSDSRSLLATLSSPPSFLLLQTLWHI